MAYPPNYYWDTCIFLAVLNTETEKYGVLIDHIQQYLDEAKQGQCVIWTSTVTIAEIPSTKIASDKYASYNEFLEDYQGVVNQVGADPNIMLLASEIKGRRHVKGPDGKRQVGTLDAIHIASALALGSDYNTPIAAFHTFDNGKSKTLEDGRMVKAVPILDYDSWCDDCRTDPIVSRVIALARRRPQHPNPRLPMPLPIETKPTADMEAQPVPTVEPPPKEVSQPTSSSPNGEDKGDPGNSTNGIIPVRTPVLEKSAGRTSERSRGVPNV